MKAFIHYFFGCDLFWMYRNPYDRTCSRCKRHQNYFVDQVYDYENDIIIQRNGRWEDLYANNTTKTS